MPNLDYIEIAKALEQQEELHLSIEEQKTFAEIWEVSSDYAMDFDSSKSFEKLNTAILQPKKTSHKPLWYAAASILVVLGAAIFSLLQDTETVYTVAKGESRTIQLDDKSEVQLQGGSELTVAANFNEETRSLKLEGVAFFDVAKNPNKAFTIETNRGTVRVLGTSFTVHAEDETQRFAVDVYEGRVQVKNETNSEILTKGMHLEIDEQGNMVIGAGPIDLSSNINQFIFVNSRIADVVTEIENKFGIEVKYNSALANQKVTLKTKAESADKLLRILSATLESEFTASINN